MDENEHYIDEVLLFPWKKSLNQPSEGFLFGGQKFGKTIPKFFDLKKLDALEVLMAHFLWITP